ncbi:hypothetical protein [Reinekea blandensis]|uniref:Uncharacterized protein n=1 Tax=Reinekea blandensis MED297 TaxID=314283 RepID=A4BJY5_9GAMM|nr:hypothetical protein [Reinekea blandensis]EAR07586.1 hypothetical protein MED297_00155 [Reinekea sp. MED297] [Reinekea blandensis MED297]
MNHKPKRPGVVIYMDQRRRIETKAQRVAKQLASLRPYPGWLHSLLDAALYPLSEQVRKAKQRIQSLQAELRRLTKLLQLMPPIVSGGAA